MEEIVARTFELEHVDARGFQLARVRGRRDFICFPCEHEHGHGQRCDSRHVALCRRRSVGNTSGTVKRADTFTLGNQNSQVMYIVENKR